MVIETSLYYDARSEKHQNMKLISTMNSPEAILAIISQVHTVVHVQTVVPRVATRVAFWADYQSF